MEVGVEVNVTEMVAVDVLRTMGVAVNVIVGVDVGAVGVSVGKGVIVSVNNGREVLKLGESVGATVSMSVGILVGELAIAVRD